MVYSIGGGELRIDFDSPSRLEDRTTMYYDMVRVLEKTGLADFIKAESQRMNSGLNAGMDRSIDEMLVRGKFIGVDREKSKKDYLKRGRFYLATQSASHIWAVFYVNPVNWFQKDSIGLVYIGWNGLLQMLERKEQNPMSISNKGWNNGLSDIAAIEDYRGLTLYNRTIAEAKKEGETYDFFREAGYTFYELPNINSNTQLGVFNWWW